MDMGFILSYLLDIEASADSTDPVNWAVGWLNLRYMVKKEPNFLDFTLLTVSVFFSWIRI